MDMDMNMELFNSIINNQTKWRREYFENRNKKMLIRRICNKKYKSKGNKNINQINKFFLENGLEEIEIIERQEGNLVFETINYKT